MISCLRLTKFYIKMKILMLNCIICDNCLYMYVLMYNLYKKSNPEKNNKMNQINSKSLKIIYPCSYCLFHLSNSS